MGSPQTLSEAERRIVALWAADCAERVLGLFEAEAPGDTRPRDAVERTRAFGRGELDVAEEIRRRFAGGGAASEVSSPAAAAAAARQGRPQRSPTWARTPWAPRRTPLRPWDWPPLTVQRLLARRSTGNSAACPSRSGPRYSSFRQSVRIGPVRWAQASSLPVSLAGSSETSRLAWWAPNTDPGRSGIRHRHRRTRARTNSGVSFIAAVRRAPRHLRVSPHRPLGPRRDDQLERPALLLARVRSRGAAGPFGAPHSSPERSHPQIRPGPGSRLYERGPCVKSLAWLMSVS